MATEIGRLSAVFDLDARPFDRGLRGVETKILGVTGVMKSLGSASVALQGPLGGVAGRLQGLSALSSQATSGIGAVGVAFAVAGAAAVGLSIALFNLVKSSARVGGELFDLSQKTSFTVETLSGLSIIAKTTGSDINSLSPSLVIFQKNMGAASDATSKQGRLFQSLSIDTRDNEKALRQAFTALAKYGDTQKAVELSTKLFGRSGKDVLAIVKETNGNLDLAIKKYEKMGLIIGTGAAVASDKFNDVLEETTLQLSAVTRSIGLELLPVATEALQSISANLAANKDAWSSWGTSISNVLRGTRAAMQSEVGLMIAKLSELFVKIQPITLLLKGLASAGASAAPGEDFFGPGGAGRGGRASLPGTPEFLAAQRRLAATQLAGIGGGGGRGGGGRAQRDPLEDMKRLAEIQVRIALEGLKREQDDIERSYDQRRIVVETYHRAITRLQQNQHQTILDDLKSEENAIQNSKTLTNAEKKIQLQEIELKRMEEMNRHRTEENRLADKILGSTRERLVTMERLVALQTRLRRAGEDIGGITRPRRAEEDIGGLTRPRIATDLEDALRRQFNDVRDQMRGLGFEMADIFDRSIADGFERGTLRGLATFGQGLARIVQENFLDKLAKGLSDILGNMATGGGFWGGLLKTLGFSVLQGAGGGVLGGIGSAGAGGLGSSFAGAIGRSSGGPMEPGNIYRVHKDETIVPMAPSFVIPKGVGGQTVVNNYNNSIQLPPLQKGSSYNSPKSARQHAEMIMAYMQGSQT